MRDEKSGLGSSLQANANIANLRELQMALHPSPLEPEGMELEHCQIAPAGSGLCSGKAVESAINTFTTGRWTTLALTVAVAAGTGITVSLTSAGPRGFLAGQSEAGTSANLSGNLGYADTNAQKDGEFTKSADSNFRVTGLECICAPPFEETTISGDAGARQTHKALLPYLPELLSAVFGSSVLFGYREGDTANRFLFGRPDFFPASGGVRADTLGQVGQIGTVRGFAPLLHPAFGGIPNTNDGLVIGWDVERTVRILEDATAFPLDGTYTAKLALTVMLRGHPVFTANARGSVEGSGGAKVATANDIKEAVAVLASTFGIASPTQDQVFDFLRRSGFAVKG